HREPGHPGQRPHPLRPLVQVVGLEVDTQFDAERTKVETPSSLHACNIRAVKAAEELCPVTTTHSILLAASMDRAQMRPPQSRRRPVPSAAVGGLPETRHGSAFLPEDKRQGSLSPRRMRPPRKIAIAASGRFPFPPALPPRYS